MMDAEAAMKRVEAVMAVQQQGDTAAAREQFAALWDELGPDADPLCRCMLAHYMADLQPDPEVELAWDLRALDAAALLTDERVRSHHDSLSVATFYPSLLLNVAESCRKSGRPVEARAYLVRAQQSVDALPDVEYGAMIRGGITRLAERLASDAPER